MLTSSAAPVSAPERAGLSAAAGRTLFFSRSRFPCSPDRISQNPCSHGAGLPLVLGLFPSEFCLNNHIIPPISMWLLWLPFITSASFLFLPYPCADSLHPGANRQYRGRGKGIHGIFRFRCKTPAPAASAQMPCRCVCLRFVCFHASFVPPFGSRPIIYPENAKRAPVDGSTKPTNRRSKLCEIFSSKKPPFARDFLVQKGAASDHFARKQKKRGSNHVERLSGGSDIHAQNR